MIDQFHVRPCLIEVVQYYIGCHLEALKCTETFGTIVIIASGPQAVPSFLIVRTEH